MKTENLRHLLGLAALLLGSGLTGCADMGHITALAQARDAASLGLPDATTATFAPVDTQWWRAFGDDTLNQLEAQALQNSPSLKLAQARLAMAQAASKQAGAADTPQLGAQAEVMKQRYTATGMFPPPLGGATSNSGTLQLSASWELDFFGKNQAALQAALGQQRASELDAQAARVLLSAQVAQSYFAWLGLAAQRDIVSRTLAQRQALLKLVQQRVQAGLDTPLELRQSQGELPQVRLQLEQLDEQLLLTRNALAALLGEPNRPPALTSIALTAIKPILLENTLSVNLLGRRADIAAARWRVQAAERGIDQARARFYPDINLSAFAGLSSIGLGELLQSGSRQWGVGPALSLPLFDGGRLRANLGGKTAERDAAVESYNATLINAVHEVADQLASASAIARQQAEQAQADQSAQDVWHIAQARYRAGLVNALQVLSSETAVLAQRRQATELSTRALQNQVALARALGGGFDPTEAAPAILEIYK